MYEPQWRKTFCPRCGSTNTKFVSKGEYVAVAGSLFRPQMEYIATVDHWICKHCLFRWK